MSARAYSIDQLSAIQIEDWNAKLLKLRVATPFLSYAFCRAVHETRGNVRVVCVEGGEGSGGFLPFQLRKGRALLGHAEKVGGTLSDMFGLVGTFGDVLDVETLLHGAALSSLRFDHGIAELCPFACFESQRTTGTRVRIDDFEQYLNSLRRKQKDFVKKVEAAGRKFEREIGKLSFAWHAVDAQGQLDQLITCKREQYRSTGKPDGFRNRSRRELLHRLLQEPAESLSRPVLSTLHCGGTWIASNLSLACGETLHIWFPAYNPAYHRYGPGHLLFFRIFESGSASGLRWFDFGQGEAFYKSRYGGESYNLWKGVIRRQSALGLSERVLQSLAWRGARIAAEFGARAKNSIKNQDREGSHSSGSRSDSRG